MTIHRITAVAVAAAGLACGANAEVAASPPIGLPNCLGTSEVRPARIVFACADGNFFARNLRWRGWGMRTARATGVAEVNDCTPYCAAGKFHTYRIVVTAAGRQSCSDGRPAYATVTYAFVGRSPFRGPRSATDATVPFPCKPRM